MAIRSERQAEQRLAMAKFLIDEIEMEDLVGNSDSKLDKSSTNAPEPERCRRMEQWNHEDLQP